MPSQPAPPVQAQPVPTDEKLTPPVKPNASVQPAQTHASYAVRATTGKEGARILVDGQLFLKNSEAK